MEFSDELTNEETKVYSFKDTFNHSFDELKSAFTEPVTFTEHKKVSKPELDHVKSYPSIPAITKPVVNRPSFPNVIATLQMDMHTMTKQLKEYRYQLSNFPPNEKQLIAWINSLEEAIHEFSNAIDLLE